MNDRAVPDPHPNLLRPLYLGIALAILGLAVVPLVAECIRGERWDEGTYRTSYDPDQVVVSADSGALTRLDMDVWRYYVRRLNDHPWLNDFFGVISRRACDFKWICVALVPIALLL